MKQVAFFVMLFTFCCVVPKTRADILILANKQKISGTLSAIAETYIEFQTQSVSGENEWVKVQKEDVIAVVSEGRKILYPRDKFDENALNFGKVRIKNTREAQIYAERKEENRLFQQELESKEKSRYKVAALVGSLSGLMLWALMDSR